MSQGVTVAVVIMDTHHAYSNLTNTVLAVTRSLVLTHVGILGIDNVRVEPQTPVPTQTQHHHVLRTRVVLLTHTPTVVPVI